MNDFKKTLKTKWEKRKENQNFSESHRYPLRFQQVILHIKKEEESMKKRQSKNKIFLRLKSD